ncbi:MAG TPA: SRPBCC domain-containing protein [Pseudolysinimonas sp.]|nr:SRPBCC domain-containing protein [Pseudolysinimonas sp.]
MSEMELTAEGARRRLRLVRDYPADAADLWEAITDPARAVRWLAALERDGEAVTLGFDGGSRRTGTVEGCDSPRELRIVFDAATVEESHLIVTLEPRDAGTRLVLQQDGMPPLRAALITAGWQHHAERLAGQEPLTAMSELLAAARVAEARAVAGWIAVTDDEIIVELERAIAASPNRVRSALPSELSALAALSDHPAGTLVRLRETATGSGPEHAARRHAALDVLQAELAGIPVPATDELRQAAHAVYGG